MIKLKRDQSDISVHLRLIRRADRSDLRDVYVDSIQSQASSFYSKIQIEAWVALANLPGIFDRPLDEGRGWVVVQDNKIEAFALRYPSDRLALLYCRGRSSRKGYANMLLDQIESDSFEQGITLITTEASLLSYSLLLRRGWVEKSIEKIEIAGISFDRYLMFKRLCF